MRRSDPIVLVFGESLNEAKAVAALIVALCPELDGSVRALPRPTSLTRDASPPKVRRWAEQVRNAVVATTAGGRPVRCVFVHRDADGPDPAGALATETERDLVAAGVPHVHAVVPVRTIEAWWLMFPAALTDIVAAWSGSLTNLPSAVDQVTDPVATLIRLTKKGSQKRGYEKSDSPRVAQAVKTLGLARTASGRSPSYTRFTAAVASCCDAPFEPSSR
jgi:hypothetical protein